MITSDSGIFWKTETSKDESDAASEDKKSNFR